MTPAELITAFRAALDAEAKAAHTAAAVCGCHPEAPSWSFGDEQTDGRIVVDNEPHPTIRRKIGRRWNGSYEGMFMAQHIVRHDPAFVLADIAAKRKLLDELLAEPHASVSPGGSTEIYCGADYGTGEPCDCGRDERVVRYVRLLAEAYGIRA